MINAPFKLKIIIHGFVWSDQSHPYAVWAPALNVSFQVELGGDRLYFAFFLKVHVPTLRASMVAFHTSRAASLIASSTKPSS
jgi:hypothetical protein